MHGMRKGSFHCYRTFRLEEYGHGPDPEKAMKAIWQSPDVNLFLCGPLRSKDPTPLEQVESLGSNWLIFDRVVDTR